MISAKFYWTAKISYFVNKKINQFLQNN